MGPIVQTLYQPVYRRMGPIVHTHFQPVYRRMGPIIQTQYQPVYRRMGPRAVFPNLFCLVYPLSLFVIP